MPGIEFRPFAKVFNEAEIFCPGLPTFSGDVDDTPSDFYERLPGISLFKVVTFPVNLSRQKNLVMQGNTLMNTISSLV